MNKRISKEKQPLILAALCEGAPIRAVARMFQTEKKIVGRVIRETGEAFAGYMDRNFRDLPCSRIEMDELKTFATALRALAGVEYERWSLEQVVEMTADYWRKKEGAKFEDAFAQL